MKITIDELKQLLINVFSGVGLKNKDATIVAEAIVDSEIRGKVSHGISRTPDLVKRIHQAKGSIKTILDDGIFAVLDGNDNLGQLLFWEVKNRVLKKCKKYGISIIAARNKFSFLSAQYYVRLLAEEGMIGILLCNGAAKVVPYGAKKRAIGTNPIAIGIPCPGGPIVLDMAISKIPSKEIDHAIKMNQKLPENCALDKDGKLTQDPIRAKEGSLLPFGEHKGSGLGIIFELLCGPLIGAKCGTNTIGKRGFIMIAIDPNRFGNGEDFLSQVETFASEIHNLPPYKEGVPVLLPGDRARKVYENAVKNGIEINNDIMEVLQKLAK